MTPTPEGDGYEEIANGVGVKRIAKPAGTDVFALAYVAEADGSGRVLFSTVVDIPGGNANVRAYHFAHLRADGSYDTRVGEGGMTRVCGDCAADHPLWSWNGAANANQRNMSVAATLPDGRVIAVLSSRQVMGFENSFFPLHDRALVRFTRDGELDASFGDQGILPLLIGGEPVRFYSLGGESIAISHQPDALGHLLVYAGNARLLKIDTDGNTVTDFAEAGVLTMERTAEPHQLVSDIDRNLFVYRQTTTLTAIDVGNGTETAVAGSFTAGSTGYRLFAHPTGGALIVRKDNPSAPTDILHIGADGSQLARADARFGTLFRDGQFLALDDDRLLYTSLIQSSVNGPTQRVFAVYDLALNPLDNPYAAGCDTPGAGCSISTFFGGQPAIYPLPGGTVRSLFAGGSTWSGFMQTAADHYHHLAEESDGWVLTRFPKP